MKKKQEQILVVLAIVLLIGGMYALYFFMPRSYHWEKRYDSEDKNPYDLLLARNIISDLTDEDGFEVLEESFSSSWIPGEHNGANYVFIGSNLYLEQGDVDSLLTYVARGNQAFISTNDAPTYLFNMLFGRAEITSDLEYYKEKTTAMTLLFSGNTYEFPNRDKYGTSSGIWTYLGQRPLVNAYVPGEILGVTNDSMVTYMAIPYGEGTFYLHTIPQSFCNLYLKNARMLPYLEQCLGYLSLDRVYFDEYGRTYKTRINAPNINQNLFSDKGPFDYILSQDGLRWAWYLLLLLALVYILFRLKRKQRPIPIIEPHQNSSLEFTQVIGRLYYQEQNHRNLAETKMKLFTADVRRHFRIQTNRVDPETVKAIAIKSKLPEAHIRDIFSSYEKVKASGDRADLVTFHRHLQQFYNTLHV